MQNLALIGKMRSGKDFAADYLREFCPGPIIKFADPLYEMHNTVLEIAGLPLVKDRKLLQLLGTEWGRSININLWVDLFKQKVRSHNRLSPIYCTDVRFPNELEMVKSLGFKTLKIIASDEVRLNRGAEHSTHESEQYIDSLEADLIIYNNDSIEDFKNALNKMFNLK